MARLSAFHLSVRRPTRTFSKPSEFSIHQNRVAHIAVPMLYSTTRLAPRSVAAKRGLKLRYQAS
jgi:hypothetical protein